MSSLSDCDSVNTLTGIVIDPPVSFPIIVNVVSTLFVSEAFGRNVNDRPTAVVDCSLDVSPINNEVVCDTDASTPEPSSVPASLFERTAVYPSVVLYTGSVVGVIETKP